MTTDLFVLREGEPTDQEYFHKSWINSFREHPWRARLGRHGLADYSELVILPHTRRSMFLVACSPTERMFILGWLCISRETAIYTCVRPRYQRVGVASTLVKASQAKYYATIPPQPEMGSLIHGLDWRPLRAIVEEKAA